MEQVTVFKKVNIKTKTGDVLELKNCTVEFDMDSFSISDGSTTFFVFNENIEWVAKYEDAQ